MSLQNAVNSPMLINAFIACLPTDVAEATSVNELGKNVWAFQKLKTDDQFATVERLFEEIVERYCLSVYNQPSAMLLEELSNQPHGVDGDNDILYHCLVGEFGIVSKLFERFLKSKYLSITKEHSDFDQFRSFWELY